MLRAMAGTTHGGLTSAWLCHAQWPVCLAVRVGGLQVGWGCLWKGNLVAGWGQRGKTYQYFPPDTLACLRSLYHMQV